jgi:hypothetical protein
MTENSKPVTRYVTLKVTYNSFFVESPETWNWNELVDCGPDENIDIISVSDFPPRKEF